MIQIEFYNIYRYVDVGQSKKILFLALRFSLQFMCMVSYSDRNWPYIANILICSLVLSLSVKMIKYVTGI